MAFQGLKTCSKSGLVCAITIQFLQESKRRVPKVNQGQLHHNYSKMQSHLVLCFFTRGRTSENGQVGQRQKYKCNQKRQNNSLHSLMTHDSGSQYPKKCVGLRVGVVDVLRKLFFLDEMKRGDI